MGLKNLTKFLPNFGAIIPCKKSTEIHRRAIVKAYWGETFRGNGLTGRRPEFSFCISKECQKPQLPLVPTTRLQYSSNLYCSAFGAPEPRDSGPRKGNSVSTPLICPPIWIAVYPPLVLQYFEKVLVVGVTGLTHPNVSHYTYALENRDQKSPRGPQKIQKK